MRIHSKQLLGLPVVTDLGRSVGKVLGCTVDTDSHAIFTYDVGKSWPSREQCEIGVAQVLAIDADRMVVRDTAVREMLSSREQASVTAQAPIQPAITVNDERAPS